MLNVTNNNRIRTPNRLSTVDPANAVGKAHDLLMGVKAKFGAVPNLFKTMAHSPALLEGYLAFSSALSKGFLPAAVREQIALYVSQANGCEYCLSAHSLVAKHAGVKADQILTARLGTSADPKTQAVLTLVRDILDNLGDVSDDQFAEAQAAGLTEGEIAEVVGHVALMTFTNYLNELAHTEIDFPYVSVDLETSNN